VEITRFTLAATRMRTEGLRPVGHICVLFFVALGLAGSIVPSMQCQTVGTGTPASIAELMQRGEHDLEEGRSTLEERTLTSARQSFEECAHLDGKNARCFYDLARTDSYLVKVADARHDKQAARWLDSAIENAQRSIDLNDQSSDAHALLADLYGSKISFGGAFAGMKYGPKANDETHRAFQLDANNPRAYAVIGRRYLYAPKIFGGDLDKAIESFRKSTELEPHGDEAFVWLAIAYRKKGDTAHAQAAIKEAVHLNGRNVFAKRIESGAVE
jgi:tetratricopeptide (TPR) repeat protein